MSKTDEPRIIKYEKRRLKEKALGSRREVWKGGTAD